MLQQSLYQKLIIKINNMATTTCPDCINTKPCCYNNNCEAPEGATGEALCIHCYAPLIEVNGIWYHHEQFDDNDILMSSENPQDIVK